MINRRLTRFFTQSFSELVVAGDRANASRDWVVAEKSYKAAIRIRSDAWAIAVQLGHALKEQGKLVEALVAYSSAATYRPDNADLQLQLGHINKLLVREQDALGHYTKAARLGAGSYEGFEALHELNSLKKTPFIYSIYEADQTQIKPNKVHQIEADGVIAAVAKLIGSGRFDWQWYSYVYDVSGNEAEVCEHYVTTGEARGFCPSPYFDPNFVKLQLGNIDHYGCLFAWFISDGWVEGVLPHPLVKSIRSDRTSRPDGHADGLAEGRVETCSHPLFDQNWYLEQNRDVRDAGVDPFGHFLKSGFAEGRDPHPLFSNSWYRRQNPKTRSEKLNPLIHFEILGQFDDAEVHPLFDTNWYRLRYLQSEDRRIHPLLHYLDYGWKLGYDPHPLFSTQWYLDRNADVAAAVINPLLHFLVTGWRQDRNPSPFFDLDWYANSHGVPAEVNPLLHFVSLADDIDVDAHPLIDAAFYKRQVASEEKALIHYLKSGYQDGVSPRESIGVVPTSRDGTVLEKAFTKALDRSDYTFESIPTTALYYDWVKAPPDLKGRNVCLFAIYAADNTVPQSTLHYIKRIQDAGFAVIAIVARDQAVGINLNNLAFVDSIVVRENIGVDFASWALVLHTLPHIWTAERILFTNDSVFGPVDDMKFVQLVEKIILGSADVYFLTDSYQLKHHGQSYFFVLQNRALQSNDVRKLWAGVRSLTSKDDVIKQYELSLLPSLTGAGMKTIVLFPTEEFGSPEKELNPTLQTWSSLLDQGFPFIKAQALRDVVKGVDVIGWEKRLEHNPTLLTAVRERLSLASEKQRVAVYK